MAIHRVTVNMRLEDTVCQNAWHVRTATDALSEGQLQDFVDGVITPQKTNTASGLSYESVEYRRVDIEGTAGSIYVPTGWPDGGGAGGDWVPSFCAFLISGIASGQIRPNKIRKFIPGVLETWTSGSVASSTGDVIRDNIASAWQTYIDGVHDAEIVSASYKNFATGIVEKSVGDRWNLITNVISHDRIALMSTRKLGRGI